jgi:hypothetical protein
MKNLREANLSKFPDGSGGFVTPVKFHEWGKMPFPLDNGSYIEISVGIVELADGTIKSVPLNNIKFDVI